MRKNERLELIVTIVSEQEIETQQELVDLLRAKGVLATQATVSRDITTLGIIKVKGKKGGYVYGLSQETAERYMTPLQRAMDNILELSQGSGTLATMVNITVVPGSTTYLKRLILDDYKDQIFSLIGDDDSLLLLAKTEQAAQTIVESFQTWMKMMTK